jgi:hypothetical protein
VLSREGEEHGREEEWKTMVDREDKVVVEGMTC